MDKTTLVTPITLSTISGTGVTNKVRVADYTNITAVIAGYNTAGMTIKCQGSVAYGALTDTGPTFSSAQSQTNMWDYIMMYDLQDGLGIQGDTGVVFSGDDVRQFQINVNQIAWLSFRCTAFASGNATIYLLASQQ